VNGYSINTLQMNYFYTTGCGQMMRVLRVLVRSHLSARDNPYATRERT
jgi:hypothetical protein